MSYAQNTGYIPESFQTLMAFVREGVNAQFGTTYTEETFLGTGWYKYFYSLVQKLQENEVKTAEIFQKLQEYISLSNERIQRPSVSHPGLIDSFESNDFVASVKPPLEADAGKIYICVDLDDAADDYATKKLAVCNLIKDFVAAGLVSQGDQVENITLSNGQIFPFKFNLPTRTPVKLRLSLVKSENTLLTIPADEEVRQVVLLNVRARYKLGYNFEPQRYFTPSDALWASTVLLEWSDDAGANWHPELFDADYTDLFTLGLDDIEVLIT